MHDLINWKYYSSWIKLTRHLAWVVKLKSFWICRKRNCKQSPNLKLLTYNEISESTNLLIKYSQVQCYPLEYRALNSSKEINLTSPLITLNPIFQNELIKVGGRINLAKISIESKNQIIVPKNHPIAELLINHIHSLNLHVGREHTLALLRKKYWVPACRGIIRKVIFNCLYCKRQRIMPKPPIMSDLPPDRLDIGTKPFVNTGIDYFGPIVVKMNRKTRANQATSKRYGVIFTCLTTRALHLELANDLSTDSFIMALRRFQSRRGSVKIIRSDNGTNFVGAENELKLAVKNIDQNAVVKHLNKFDITWMFNPPISPWMGGVWESLIKSVKRALKAITHDRLFTDEALYTFLCEVESILNQRPITTVSDDINDFEVLTPNHFLLGYESYNLAPGKFNDDEINLRKKWRKIQAVTNMFWRRWVNEYLPLLNIRKKWYRVTRNFNKGDIVIIQTNNSPRSFWPMARVIETYPGIDGVVRTVKVKTATNELVRSVAKLCLLECHE